MKRLILKQEKCFNDLLAMERNWSTTILYFIKCDCHNHNYFFFRSLKADKLRIKVFIKSTFNKYLSSFSYIADIFLHAEINTFYWTVLQWFKSSMTLGNQLSWQPVEEIWDSPFPSLMLVSHILISLFPPFFFFFWLLFSQSLGYNLVTDWLLAEAFTFWLSIHMSLFLLEF